MSGNEDSIEEIKFISKGMAYGRVRLSNLLNIHGKKDPNFCVLDQIAQKSCSVPTILSADVRSFAQYGEDVIVKGLLLAHAKERYREKKIFYLDIGANHPVNMSNTWLFYEEGMMGVLVEPNSALHEEIARTRPRDILIKGAVATGDEKEADFFIPRHHELASLRSDFINAYHKQRGLSGDAIECVRVQTFDINAVVEGADLDILRSLDLTRYRPTIICVEPSTGIVGCGLEDNDELIKNYLADQGYVFAAATPANMIYLNYP